MSSKEIAEENNQEAIAIEEKLIPETVLTESSDPVIKNEDNYK